MTDLEKTGRIDQSNHEQQLKVLKGNSSIREGKEHL